MVLAEGLPALTLIAAVQDGMPGQLPMYKGTLDAVKTIVRTEGWKGLYAGLTPSIIGSSELLLAAATGTGKEETPCRYD